MLADRKSIYFRKSKDKDLINYISKRLVNNDFAEIVRSLMRDGIKYREMKQNSFNKAPAPTQDKKEPPTLTENTPKITPEFKKPLEKKKLSEEDLRDRLDGF